MPSVGMRRTTRVFGVVKGADAARVLRSGRRLWPESGEGKTKRGSDGDEWLKMVKNSGKNDTWARGVVKTKQEVAVVGAREHEDDVGIRGTTKPRRKGRSASEANGPDKMFGIVYSRKRKRLNAESSGLSDNKILGMQFSRGQGTKIGESEENVLGIVVKPFCGKSFWFSCFLFLVLSYIKRVRLTLKELSAFVLSEPIYGAFASRGIQFLQGPPTANIGICKLFGITRFIPLFCVDFLAVPHCFEYLHSAVLLRSMFRSFYLVNNLITVHSNDEEEIDFPEFQNERQISYDSFKRESSDSGIVKPDAIEINDSLSLHSAVKGSRLAGRNGQYRNIVISRDIQGRRSSLRKRKAQNPSLGVLHRSNGALASDLMDGRKNIIPVTGVASRKKPRSLASSYTVGSFKEASSATVDSTEGLDLSLCSVNLVAEPDGCYRIEGAIVALEMSASREWLLAVKKDGSTRCTFKAEKVMRPCSSNRLSHVITFSLNNGWKLEFANRRDWIVFKDLYKECSDRNLPSLVGKFIPVPDVRDVSGYVDRNSFPFQRPDAYIFANGDELSRAMTRRTANYDMDSEDEEWLSKFNNEFQEHVSEDNFELIIDALEKACYCNPEDCLDEKSAANLCQDLGNNEVVEAVYSYWTRKRKQKRSLLLRVFQGHQLKRAPLIPKPLLRKRRSFKRQPSQFSRGKQPSVLQAIAAAEQDALEEKNGMLRVEEARASANKSMELAIQKRRRAQSLAENADLATYKATMLIRIAEAAQAAESVGAMAGYFL